jgi:1-acyl-sn-glycerol-3-phosphate acyltransferase
MPWFYYVGRVIARMLVFLCTRCQVRGRENVPKHGPLLVAANHINMADPPLLAVSLGRVAIFMAKEELYRSRFIAYFVRSFGSFPVHRGQLDRQAIRDSEQVLARGQALVMFPEGMRSHVGQLRSGFPGAALIASRSGAPILPVGITGTESVWGKWWWLHRPKITVNIGVPFHLPPTNGKVTRAELAENTKLIMVRIAELLPPEYRGDYQEVVA